MEASQPPPRLAGQRKRSYSTTAYSSHEEESPLAASAPSLPTCLLATAVGTQVMTYEFIKHGTEPMPPSKPTTVSPGQYEGILMSNERTTYGAISSLKWSPDNTILAVEAQDGRIIVYNNKGKVQEALVSEPVLETSRTGSNRCAISWSPKPQRLYYANGYSISAWDSASKRTTECFEIMAKLEYSVFNKSLLGTAGNDGILRLWDTGSNGSSSVFHSFSATHSVPISGMAFSPFNKYLVCTTGLDGRYSLYDVEQKTVVKNTLTEHPLTSIAFKSDGVSMAFGTDQGRILLYDLRSTSRPISVVDTRVNASVSAIHFQGKPSSASKHATNGHTLKRQHSVGGKTTNCIAKEADSIGGGIALVSGSSSAHTLTNNTAVTESAASQPYKSIFSKPTAIRTNTLSNSSLNLLGLGSGSGSKPSRDTLAAGAVNKGTSIFPTSRPTEQDSEKAVSFKPQRPPPPTSVATKMAQTNMTGTTTGSTSTMTPITRSHTAPTTPVKEKSSLEQPTPHQGSYPNSRTASPYSFQIMQSRSPSGSPSSASSVNHTPPGSPAHGSGAKPPGGSSLSLTSQSHLQHHHYSTSSDPPSGAVSPSVSRAKRRKSFGKLVAPGGIGSPSSVVTDPLSNERMEIISGQIADRVRNVLLSHPEPALGGQVDGSSRTDSSSAGKQASSSKRGTPTSHSQPTPLPSTASQKQPSTEMYSGAPSRPKDLWMQVGSEGTGSKPSGSLSSTSMAVDSWSREAPSTDTASSFGQGGQGQGGVMLPSFSSKVLENVIEGCLMEFRTGIRNDIQNMHLELLRQFQIQKLEMEALLREYSDTRELRDEIERLRDENRRLKTNY
ncbi:Protein nedd1 [Podila minutissima]|uniref:Protein nedd1 n=1 Tax=Podila minutissima TaxID=64525 RepID=A0A9P5VMU9_9FUNG|nr:Protein nedd1 [Podila minutissima]